MHTHYDADGVVTGTTVVTRETEWDDETRERALNLAAHEDSICSCGCGQPVAESTKAQPFVVDTFTCYAGRAKAQKQRLDAEAAREANKPAGWDDGVIYYVRGRAEPKEG